MRQVRKFIIVLLALMGVVVGVRVALTRAAAPRVVVTPSSARTNADAAPNRSTAAQVTERWRTALAVNVVGLPEVDADGVVVTAGESQVVALANDGKTLWTTAVAGALVNPPRLDGDLVFVAAKRAVVALRRDSGTVVWAAPTAGDGVDENRANRPVVAGNIVVVSTASGRVFGFDRATGGPQWTVDLPTAVTSEPAVGAGVAVVVGIGEWSALDPATGVMLWSADLGDFGTSSPVVYDDAGRALTAVASDGRLVAADLHTGEVIWRVAAEQSELYQVPVVTEANELLVPDHWGRMAAYDPHDGRRLWQVRGADGVAEFGAPAALGHQIVALSLDADGPRLGSPGGSTALHPPAAGHGVAVTPDGVLVVTTWDAAVNYVVAYDVRAPNR